MLVKEYKHLNPLHFMKKLRQSLVLGESETYGGFDDPMDGNEDHEFEMTTLILSKQRISTWMQKCLCPMKSTMTIVRVLIAMEPLDRRIRIHKQAWKIFVAHIL
ncbi:uncharacterized protein LOC131249089 [Magnolia sinica]|uniref:uncharacterized protein LOC131249089 n=1 Tax=Magnolia sinica TaxID=86752 RepID=UPI00265A8C41|nr:uncharacterized protein LOC131249089 [Magnolia sinica]